MGKKHNNDTWKKCCLVILVHFNVTYLLISSPAHSIFHMEQIHLYTEKYFLEIKACGNIFILNNEWNETEWKQRWTYLPENFDSSLHFTLIAIYSLYSSQYIVPRFHSYTSPELIHTRTYMGFSGFLRESIHHLWPKDASYLQTTTIYRHEKQALI